MSELKITTRADPSAHPIPPLDGTTPERDRADILARRNAVVNQSRVRAAAAAAEPEEPAKPIEDIESVEVVLPNGHTVLFGPPPAPLSLRIGQMLGTQASSLLISIMSTLMFVREIDGTPVPPIGDQVQAQVLLNRIGDDGLDVLSMVNQECWPPVDRRSLPVLTKRYRGS